MAGNDDDDKGRKTNDAPLLKPPGLTPNEYAPAGTVGTGKPWLEGPVYIGGFGSNPFRKGRTHEPSPVQESSAQNKATPRFHETGDSEVDREYAKNHVMVRQDGTELMPGDLVREENTPESSQPEKIEPGQDAPDKNGMESRPEKTEQDKESGRPDDQDDLSKYYANEHEQPKPDDELDLDRFYGHDDSRHDGHGSDSELEKSQLSDEFNDRSEQDDRWGR